MIEVSLMDAERPDSNHVSCLHGRCMLTPDWSACSLKKKRKKYNAGTLKGLNGPSE
jgi:hypothetical protein